MKILLFFILLSNVSICQKIEIATCVDNFFYCENHEKIFIIQDSSFNVYFSNEVKSDSIEIVYVKSFKELKKEVSKNKTIILATHYISHGANLDSLQIRFILSEITKKTFKKSIKSAVIIDNIYIYAILDDKKWKLKR